MTSGQTGLVSVTVAAAVLVTAAVTAVYSVPDAAVVTLL
jgi:hypothetical protein